MKRDRAVGIRDLKSGLSAYLRRVRRGEALLVTDRGEPVARIAYVESRAFLGRIRPERRATAREATRVRRLLDGLWRGFAVVDLDAELASLAGDLAERHGLRGMAAVHLASALRIARTSEEPTTFATCDGLSVAARRQRLRLISA